MKALKILFFSVVAVAFIAFGVLMVKKVQFDNAHDGINITGGQIDYPYSGYSISDGKIYYNKPGSGYFLVKGADINTFRPLNTVSDRGTMAKDTNHIFFKTDIIPGLKTEGFSYVGNNFCKDHNQAFYGDMMLKDADVATLTHIRGYYASDKKYLYYKQNVIAGAHLRLLQVPAQQNLPDEYLADDEHVYYKGNLIKGAKPAAFTALTVEDDQWHTQYAFDGEHYFNDQYEITTEKDGSATPLQLLSLDKGFGWHGIFYKGTAIYCYDTDHHELILLGNRDNSSPFKMIDRGIFTDDKHVYFTFGKWNKAGGRMTRYTGHTTGICVVEGANPGSFKAIGNFTTSNHVEGKIYQSGNKRYFHPTYETNDNYHPGLLLLKTDGTTDNLPLGDALSKSIKNDDGPSIFSKKFYQNLFKPDSDYRDH